MKKKKGKRLLLRDALIVSILALTLVIIIGCSSADKGIKGTNFSNNSADNASAPEEDKEALYGQALLGLAEEESFNAAALEKRFNTLNSLVNKILQGEKELEMATFTRVKIELDYLRMKNYTSDKVDFISANFQKAFAVAEQAAKETEAKNKAGLSLNDRYFSLSSKIEKLSSNQTQLKVAEYLQIEEGLKALEQEGYIPSRVNALRSKLFQAVIAELESAIVDYEIPEIEPEIEEKAESITENVTEEAEKEAPKGPQTVVVKLIDGGFNTEAVKIKVGDTVEWKNARKGHYKVGLVVGNRECLEAKSKIYTSGESFNFTFTKPMTCWISDGIYTTQAMRVIVS